MFRFKPVALGLCAVLLGAPAWAQDSVSALIEQGKNWQARKDNTRATEIWEKLLQISPDNAQALDGLGRVALDREDLATAKTYLDRLQAAHPGSLLAKEFAQDYGIQAQDLQPLLDEARKYAAANQMDEAIATYKQVFGGKTPEGSLALEYYTRLGFTDDGLSEALAGLQRLRKEFPNDPQIQFALAVHMVRRDESRVEGIERLARLSERKDIGPEALEAWRDSLLWMGPLTPGAGPLYQAYLAKHPDDAQILEALQEGKQARAEFAASANRAKNDPLSRQAEAGLKKVREGDLSGAEDDFRAVLAKRANDSQALGGMGIVRMRQSRWSEARDYLERARRRNAGWQGALNQVGYWEDVERAEDHRRAGRFDEARKLLTQAMRQQPKEVAAEIAMADLLLDEGELDKARAGYEAALKKSPGETGALAGLAKVARASGDVEKARRALEDAMADHPDDPWLRYQLAQLYIDAGRTRDAEGLIKGLLVTHPDDPQVLYANAMFESQQNERTRARELMDQIPEEQRTPAMRRFYAELGQQLQMRQLVQQGKGGQKAAAMADLERIVAGARPDDVKTLASVARAYADMDELGRGLDLLRPLRQEKGPVGIDASMAYAELLLRADQAVEAGAIIRRVAGQPLSETQRRALTDLSDSYRIHEADALREAGDLAAAYDMLAPVLDRKPKDPLVVAALARMYAAAGKGDQAMGLVDDLLRTDPDNADLHLSAAQIAMQLRDGRRAEREAQIAVSLAPENTDVLSGAAQVYRFQGKTLEAQNLLEQAVALEQQQRAPDVAVAAAPDAVRQLHSDNPFAELADTRRANVDVAAIPIPDDDALAPRSALGSPGADEAIAPEVSRPQAENPFERQSAQVAMTSLERELDEIRQIRSPEVRAGLEFRHRNGDDGTSRLTEVQAPMEVRLPVGNGKLAIQVTPTVISAGSIGESLFARGYFLSPGNTFQVEDITRPDAGTQRGVGLALAYETRGMTLDAGITPLGFQRRNWVGGALFEGVLDQAGTAGWRFDLSRRAVTDSVLSFGGVHDDVTGLEWGGVTATGARLTLMKDFGRAGIYGSAAWHQLKGHNVASNERSEFNLGTFYRFIDEKDTQLMAGVNLNASFFQKNLSYYTYGHGGYFSPSHYYSIGLPVTWAQRRGPLTWRLDGSVGWQRFRQDDTPVYPNNGDIQHAIEADAARFGISDPATYPGQSKSGVGYNLRASTEYRVAPQWVFGATLGADNASDYRQWVGGLYLRYYLVPQTGAMDLPVVPYRSPYGNVYGR